MITPLNLYLLHLFQIYFGVIISFYNVFQKLEFYLLINLNLSIFSIVLCFFINLVKNSLITKLHDDILLYFSSQICLNLLNFDIRIR